MDDSLKHRLDRIQEELPPTVKLIGVSKTFPPELIDEAYKLGLRDFGENRVQEVHLKRKALGSLPKAKWHLIGHLQTNKLKLALQLFDYIHSVDREELLVKLSEFHDKGIYLPKLLLQVRLLPDPDKYGMTAEQASEYRSRFSRLPICGLMTILPQGLKTEEAHRAFLRLRMLADELGLAECSMGMSGDYQAAIKAGSTMIRLGQALFGMRDQHSPSR